MVGLWLMGTSLLPSCNTLLINRKILITSSEFALFFHNNLKKIKKAIFYVHLSLGQRFIVAAGAHEQNF